MMCVAVEDNQKKCLLGERTVVGDSWLAHHRSHGTVEKSLNKHQPPSYRLVTYACSCGKKMVDIEEKEQ